MNILYEDSHVIAVDKPAGLSAIPERDRTVESLLGRMEGQTGQKLFVVHRVDKGVSGVMLFARTAEAHRHLNLQFDRREIRKTYRALVHGVVARDTGTIDRPLRQCGSGRVAVDDRRGKPSVTEYRVVRRLTGTTLLDVHPRTGRRHQIRVHLYSMGHPIVGDRRYGDAKVQAAFPRLMLHAAAIAFCLPGGTPLTISSPVPEEFTAAEGSV